MRNHFSKGFAGENKVRLLLENVIGCIVAHHKGSDDIGFDFTAQMESTGLYKTPLFFQVQVKTGDSFVSECENYYKIKKGPLKKRWGQWKKSNTPVLFIWLKESAPINAFWQLIEPTSSIDHFFISKRKEITPLTRFDISLKLDTIEKSKTPIIELFTGNIGKSFRNEAKDLYRKMMKKELYNPLLGETRITWHGWKHITHQRRSINNIFNSLRLLPAIPACVETPDDIIQFRRINDPTRGKWHYNFRFIVFKKEIMLKNYSPMEIAIVLKEIIKYPHNWENASLEPYKKISRVVIFESIYRLKKK